MNGKLGQKVQGWKLGSEKHCNTTILLKDKIVKVSIRRTEFFFR